MTGAFTNNNDAQFGNNFSGSGDTLNVKGTFTNAAGALFTLIPGSGDVANLGTLVNNGNLTIGTGTTLNLTNQPNGITDVPSSSGLLVDGTLNAGSANGLAKLTSVEGNLTLANGQTTADTPSGGTLTVAGRLTLNNSGTTLSVTGTLSDSASVTVNTGATLNLTQAMTDLPATGSLSL